MSISSLKTFLENLGLEPGQLGTLENVFSSADALMAYAASRGCGLEMNEAEALIAQARDQMPPREAEPLSDESLDVVNGAGWRHVHMS
ncbi:hypothetical protein GCM10007301_37960 [Azorhizobium oxalatiphilum]|uniref:Uncharacterized protein n=1 Tax=Azorhizobium oxalatiphilum TaxID=980631 RepID=A0A917C6L0_9HYPH|nr:hypothetical protein [Azorhizobium oxalatiphilum]GGF74512.1 hypothetical protein GCM10007301_37960 [Azorhizobium oxalatiphilum]